MKPKGLLAFAKKNGIHGSQRFCGGVEVGAGGEGFEFVGNGDVGSDEVEFAHLGKRRQEVVLARAPIGCSGRRCRARRERAGEAGEIGNVRRGDR